MWKVPWDPFLIFFNTWTVLLQYMSSTATVQNSNFCPPKSTYAGKRKKKKKKKNKQNAKPKRGRRKTGNPNALYSSIYFCGAKSMSNKLSKVNFGVRKSILYRKLYRFDQRYNIFWIPINIGVPFRVYRYFLYL